KLSPIDFHGSRAQHEDAERKRRRHQIERRERDRASLQPPLNPLQSFRRAEVVQAGFANLHPGPVRESGTNERPGSGEQRRQPEEDAARRAKNDADRVDAERQCEKERRIERGQRDDARKRHKESDERVDHRSVTSNATAMTLITTVALQPRIRRRGVSVNSPITSRRFASSMMATMIGALATPLITALQNNARIGSNFNTFSPTPPSVEMAISR